LIFGEVSHLRITISVNTDDSINNNAIEDRADPPSNTTKPSVSVEGATVLLHKEV
jgi:hypothetical protein